MEWNTKWDWENLDVFSSKGAASPKKMQSAYWGIEADGSFNLSDVGNNSSTKSSISASTESSSFKEGMKGSNISFEGFGCLPDSYIEGSNISSVCSGEPFIGLKLGKRTYFENSYAKSTNHRTSSILGVPVSMGKKVKPSSQTTPITRCQVEGCNLDLSSSKDYHRKHRVCERHSKFPKVIVGGVERRFCQQCSRFHDMSEFDEEKRSCRRRLSDHNARRRKPQQELNQFNSSIPYSSFYDPPLVQTSRPAISSTWETTSKYSSTGVQFSDALNRSVPPKGVFHLGFKEPLSSNVDAVDLHHALSLLSYNSNSNSNSWGSSDIPLDHPHHRMQHSMPQDSVPPLSSQDYYWQQQSIHAKTSNHFQEFQIFKSPYDNSFPFHPSG